MSSPSSSPASAPLTDLGQVSPWKSTLVLSLHRISCLPGASPPSHRLKIGTETCGRMPCGRVSCGGTVSCGYVHSLLDRTIPPTTNQVVNLSSRVLTGHELSVLSRGLNFCPTPGEPKKGDLVRELDYFHDNLRWEYHFRDNPTSTQPFDKLIMTSKVFKKTHRPSPPPAHRKAFIFLNERDLQLEGLREPRAKNLSKEEKLALSSLKQDPFIMIKEADKGGAVVIMNTKDYVAEAQRQLADPKYYLPANHDQTPEFSDRVETYLTSLFKKQIFSKCVYDRISTRQPRTPAFYHNPKIHKSNTILGTPPGRPIISGNGCATEKISALVDLCINPLVPCIPSFVKDTTHFLCLLQE